MVMISSLDIMVRSSVQSASLRLAAGTCSARILNRQGEGGDGKHGANHERGDGIDLRGHTFLDRTPDVNGQGRAFRPCGKEADDEIVDRQSKGQEETGQQGRLQGWDDEMNGPLPG